MVAASIGLEKVTCTVLTSRNRSSPSFGSVATTCGEVASVTTLSVSGSESVVFPPVSVARNCSTSCDADPASLGAVAERSNGKETALRTTCPFNSNSTRQICTSSRTSARTLIVDPSATWIPGVFGSASIATARACLDGSRTP